MDCCRRHCRDFTRDRNSACVQLFHQSAVILLLKTARPLCRADWKLHIIFVCIIRHNAQILNFSCKLRPVAVPDACEYPVDGWGKPLHCRSDCDPLSIGTINHWLLVRIHANHFSICACCRLCRRGLDFAAARKHHLHAHCLIPCIHRISDVLVSIELSAVQILHLHVLRYSKLHCCVVDSL